MSGSELQMTGSGTLRWVVMVASASSLMIAFFAGCSSGGESESTSGSAVGERERSEAAANARLDLEALLTPVPEYESQGRNLFAFGSARRQAPTAGPSRPRTPTSTSIRPATVPAPSIAPSRRVDVKYAGFVEKPVDGGKKKYAIFIDGKDILAGAEGDSVRSFTIVQIGLESVTVPPDGSTTTQRIPLQSN